MNQKNPLVFDIENLLWKSDFDTLCYVFLQNTIIFFEQESMFIF